MNETRTERPLGRSGISVPALGVGTNRWDTSGPGGARLTGTLSAALDAGMGFFDTAEAYSSGRSELALCEAARQDGRPVLLASKFAPSRHRVTTAQFASALDKTLERLGRDSLDLYYLHFPRSLRSVGTWMRAMARAVKAGKIRAVGISNCNAAQMRRAADVLARYDIPLAANQVQYSLLHREPETDGLLDACRGDGRHTGRIPADRRRGHQRCPTQRSRPACPCWHAARSGGCPRSDCYSGGARLAA